MQTSLVTDHIAPSLAPPAILGGDDLPGPPYRAVVVRDAATLRGHKAAWERLIDTALEPNAFYEPFVLLPAMDLLVDGAALEVVLIYGAHRKNPANPPVLCGLFPLERKGSWGPPATHLRFWRHRYCFLNLPLVRRDVAADTLGAFFDWLAGPEARVPLFQFNAIPGSGPFHELMLNTLFEREQRFWLTERWIRAMFVPAADTEAYLQRCVSRKQRHELKRLRRRLAESGKLEITENPVPEQLDAWIDEFLRLEALGWKGREGTAFACSNADQWFLRRMMHGAARRGKLLLQGMKFDDRHIAMAINLVTGDGGFAFKIAYDEQLHRFSPGVQLEFDKIARFQARPGLRWLDSCADPGHPMIDRLWGDRRTIENLWVATGRRPGDLLLALGPLAKWARDLVRGRRPRALPAHAQEHES
ncbi:MAG: GNAT family N-acetyltransferase [Pirellulales bacterium]|nr:GNAT family N-acetyltransferase [Pirellulales bacterium]